MLPLRYLKQAVLVKGLKVQQSNGSWVEEYSFVKDFLVDIQALNDEISASLYGADMNKTYRVVTPHHELEKMMMEKTNSGSDNVTKYALNIGDYSYRIVSARDGWLDVELLRWLGKNQGQ